MVKKRSGRTTSTPKRQPQAQAEDKGAGTCLVLMPFGGWFDQYYESIFKPALQDAGLTPRRADDLYRPGTIVNDIWTFTQSAQILIADLSGRNPNVFYELGLAHALAKPVILVAESIDQVPFDLRALRVLEYDKNDPVWGDRLRTRITKSVQEVLEAPLEAVLPTFLRVDRESKQEDITEQEKAILELRHDMDVLRRQVRSHSIHFVSNIENQDSARVLIARMRSVGYSDHDIRKRLVVRGVPEWWLDTELGRQQSLFDSAQDEDGGIVGTS